MKKYVIVAGVNGAGKSTLYQSDNYLKNMPRINVDEIVKEIGNWQNTKYKNRTLMRVSRDVPNWFSKVTLPLTSYQDRVETAKSLFGILPKDADWEKAKAERLEFR